jgi:tetratricopeptide (TPR) repeat protein
MLTFQGVSLRERRKTKEAIEVFECQHRLYPKSLNALRQLGETYRAMGEIEKAGDCYEQFLKICDMDAALIHSRLNQMRKMLDSSAAYRIEQEIRQNGIQAGLTKYQWLRSDAGKPFYFDENEFNAMGYRLMEAGNMEAALEIFRLNGQLYPKSANVYDSLREAYLKIGDNDNATKNYRKSLELNPENTNASDVLKRLEKK